MARFRKISKRIAKKTKLRVRRKMRRPSKVARIARTVARAVVARNIENKQVYKSVGPVPFNNALTTGDFQTIIPDLGVGTGNQQRIGNEVKMLGTYLKGSVHVNLQNTAVTPVASPFVYVRIMILLDKTNPGTGVSSAAVLERNGVNVAPTGAVFDVMSPIDKNRFQVLFDKKIKLQNSNYALNSTGYVNPNFIGQRYIRYKLPSRVLKYLESSSAQPTNYMPQMGMFLVDPLQILTPGSTGTNLCTYNFETTMYYQDA